MLFTENVPIFIADLFFRLHLTLHNCQLSIYARFSPKPNGLEIDLRAKNGQNCNYPGTVWQACKFLLYYSPDDHKFIILTITRGYSPLKSTSSTIVWPILPLASSVRASWLTCEWLAALQIRVHYDIVMVWSNKTLNLSSLANTMAMCIATICAEAEHLLLLDVSSGANQSLLLVFLAVLINHNKLLISWIFDRCQLTYADICQICMWFQDLKGISQRRNVPTGTNNEKGFCKPPVLQSILHMPTWRASYQHRSDKTENTLTAWMWYTRAKTYNTAISCCHFLHRGTGVVEIKNVWNWPWYYMIEAAMVSEISVGAQTTEATRLN